MSKSTRNKSIGWLKGVLTNQNTIVENNVEEPVSTETNENELSTSESSANSDASSNQSLFSKENQDKVSLDLIVSVENMLNDRHLLLYNQKDLEEQLSSANETISYLKHDLTKKEQLIQDKNQEISKLESNLTNKQMTYDQLLEDYKDYQYRSQNDYEKISNQLETEIHKYNKLKEEATNTQYESMLKIKELEENIRSLEAENEKYEEQYQRILKEKEELMKTINDFTERMTLSFSPKTTTSTHSE